MRLIVIAAGWLMVGPQLVRAADAVAVVEKAIQATATSDLRLNRLTTVVRTDRGSLFLPTGTIVVERTAYLNPPDRIKYEAHLTTGGDRQAMIIVLNGLTGWQRSAGHVKDLGIAEADAVRDSDADAWSLVTLLPLRQKGTRLTALPPITVAGKQLAGVNVARPGRPDAQLYFASTGLLSKMKVKVREAGVETAREWDLGGYRAFDGIKLPTRITVSLNGRKIEDWTISGYRFPDKLDDKLFAKPK